MINKIDNSVKTFLDIFSKNVSAFFGTRSTGREER